MQNRSTEEIKFLKEADVSNMTRYSLPKLRNDQGAGKGIPYYKLGRSVRYRYSDVISFMERGKVETDND
jgi:hypothetical protein